MNKKWYLVILLALGLLTHFMFFGHPDQTVFDEVHFGKFVSGYYTREYFFDIHPPLGKLAIAGFAKLFNFKPEFAFSQIGDKFPDKQYLILRFLPNLAGALLPAVIFLLLMSMGMNRIASFSGGLFIALENSLLTQSHYILLDSFLLLFGFLSLLFYFEYSRRETQRTKHLLLFGLFAGLTLSVKWTGLGFLALPLAIEAVRILRSNRYKDILRILLPPLLIAAFIYFIFFAIHLKILNKSGSGDAFMTVGFQKTLIGNSHANDDLKSPNIFQKFSQLNLEMYKANQRLVATHPYSSSWYTWPTMARPIYYWVSGNARIYLLGNPLIWWASTMAIIISIVYCVLRIKEQFKDRVIGFLLAGYTINMLPFIGVKRVMFLYHYFIAYIFAIMILVWLIDRNEKPKIIFITLLVLSAIAFVYFAPLSYGLDLSPKAYESHIWLKSWR